MKQEEGMPKQPESCLHMPGVGDPKEKQIPSLSPNEHSVSVAIAQSTFLGIC